VATALQDVSATPPSPGPAQPNTYRCECGHVLNVFGRGRHRLYFEPEDSALVDPIMNRVCPNCGRGLPGKNTP